MSDPGIAGRGGADDVQGCTAISLSRARKLIYPHPTHRQLLDVLEQNGIRCTRLGKRVYVPMDALSRVFGVGLDKHETALSKVTAVAAEVGETAERLAKTLSDPVKKPEIANLLDISLGSVYDSLRKFRAARANGDEQGMRDNIPCIPRGSRFIVPREAFIRWYVSAGLDHELLERLYGKGA
jgi:hypothetical protein